MTRYSDEHRIPHGIDARGLIDVTSSRCNCDSMDATARRGTHSSPAFHAARARVVRGREPGRRPNPQAQ
ncbi:hypothetical protein WI41_02760 [Burkholderia latens]|uniref:Uncharacterized protein n=1 Tax=Burkholderia latens TaxID=488446 RepID=A0AAP1BY68_9BURK|nr:hypothetical protein WK25_19665 [Burkholderia latens]KUZ97596.1 hypothetical protein WI41_02760 [Burkholderia latens]